MRVRERENTETLQHLTNKLGVVDIDTSRYIRGEEEEFLLGERERERDRGERWRDGEKEMGETERKRGERERGRDGRDGG